MRSSEGREVRFLSKSGYKTKHKTRAKNVSSSPNKRENVYAVFFLSFQKLVREWNMCDLRSTIVTCVSLAGGLIGKNLNGFISELSGDDAHNLNVFEWFAGGCPSLILAVLFRLGHFANRDQLLRISGEMLEVRRCFEEAMNDAGGHINYLLAHYQRLVSQQPRGNGKFLFQYIKLYFYFLKVKKICMTILKY